MDRVKPELRADADVQSLGSASQGLLVIERAGSFVGATQRSWLVSVHRFANVLWINWRTLDTMSTCNQQSLCATLALRM